MKLSKSGRIALASVLSVGLGFGVVACGPPNTIDFVYVTSAKPSGQINVYKVDSQAGALIQLAGSPYSSGGANPVADVSSPNGRNLYVINHDDNTVVEFAINTNGTIANQQTCTTPGSFPTQLAINKAGTYLYVVETYQPGHNAKNPGPGGALVVYPIDANGQLGATSSLCTPVANGSNAFFPVGNNPAAVNVVASGTYVYAVNQSDATLSGFQVGSGGSLTSIGTFPIGVSPNAIASDPTSRWLYVTDGAANQMIGFQIQLNGTLIPLQTPFKTDNLPDSVQVDPRGIYVYVANYNANDVSAYVIDRTTGNATQIAGSTAYAVDAGPTCVLIDPAEARFVYTSNSLGNTVSGFTLNPATGALTGVQNTPFKAAGQPTCGAAIAHGNHAIEVIQP
jgi:6-phosphogluconolactonase